MFHESLGDLNLLLYWHQRGARNPELLRRATDLTLHNDVLYLYPDTTDFSIDPADVWLFPRVGEQFCRIIRRAKVGRRRARRRGSDPAGRAGAPSRCATASSSRAGITPT